MLQTAVAEPTIVRLDQSSVGEAKSLLYNAYRYEPTFQYLFDAGKPGYDQRVRATIREGVELHFSMGQEAIGLVHEDSLVAVAFISRPDIRLNLVEQFSWRIRMMLTAGFSATNRFIEYHEGVMACLPKGVSHRLPLLGVHPKHQSKGFGRALMGAVERICREDPRSCGIGLDTGNSRYLKFYESLGYQKVGEVRLGKVVETVLFKPCI